MKLDPADLIINHPELVAPGQKFTALGITLFFWGALLYLWQPLLSLVAWGFNIRLFTNHMILLGGYRTLFNVLMQYLAVISLLGGSLIIWARINQWRFRGKDRRCSPSSTDIDALLRDSGMSPDELALAKQSRIIRFSQESTRKIRVVELPASPRTGKAPPSPEPAVPLVCEI